MELKNIRVAHSDGYTIGRFYVNDILLCDSLEDKDRGLTLDMSLQEIQKKKVFGKTAIPIGRYEVIMTHSEKFASRPWARATESFPFHQYGQ